MKPSTLYRLTHAAEACGLPRSTLKNGCERGELPVVTTGCGLRLVTLADVKAWAKQERAVGRPPKK